jgi:Heat induced stress protein YflT domain
MALRSPFVTPEPPTGYEVQRYSRYVDAQAAVDFLSDEGFEVQNLTIVGTDLQQVERVTGRWSVAKAVRAGALTGAVWGVVFGILLSLFGTGGTLLILLVTVPIMALVGMFNGWMLYRSSGGRRDFTSSTQVVATSYQVLCHPQHADKARELIAKFELKSGRL